MTNDDLTADHNQNGLFEPSEVLNGNHIVVADNKFGEVGIANATGDIGLNLVTAFTATHVLVTRNHVAHSNYIFSSMQGKLDTLNLGLAMDFSNLVVSNNSVDALGLSLLALDGYWHDQDVPVRGTGSNPNTMTLGRYRVRDNTTLTARDQISALVSLSNTTEHALTEPNSVTGNLCGGAACDDLVVHH